jgi:antitoxin ParD1/3/4
MNVNLKPEYEHFIKAQIEAGQFTSVDDVINEAIKLLELRVHKLEALKRKIALGTQQIKEGRVTDGEIVFARLQEKIRLIASEGGE